MARSGIRRIALAVGVSLLALVIYSYPSWKLRADLGPNNLPPIVAPDLTLYLNLANITPLGNGEILNPYYRIPVPANAAGYLKFDLAARSFGIVARPFHSHTWIVMFLWNAFWWACFCSAAIWLFACFLPSTSQWLVAFGVALLMLFNFGIAKNVLLAWAHLPSLAAFKGLDLPFIRAFIPVIPCALALTYLGCQIETLRRGRTALWIAMAVLQLLALAVFPYATLIMAGITAAALAWLMIRSDPGKIWRTALVYAIPCTLLDVTFLHHGSLGFYANRSSAIHLQLRLLPHLIGGNWMILVALTGAIAFMRQLPPEIKWPLVGLGASNALLMLGDALVPATKILLSHHAGYFLHTTIAVLFAFLIAAFSAFRPAGNSSVARGLVAVVLLILILNGVLTALGTYRAFLGVNREAEELSNLQRLWTPTPGDLIIARSKVVDDACGWISLTSSTPVLFCTDAEVMLSPQQDIEIHRFRQALYLYFTGEDSSDLEQKLSSSDPRSTMYRLGYWGEAVSTSLEERNQGISQIETDLLTRLKEVEERDPSATEFLANFKRIIVIDEPKEPAFASERLAAFLVPGEQYSFGDFEVQFYKPR